jgi:hypothetical protein
MYTFVKKGKLLFSNYVNGYKFGYHYQHIIIKATFYPYCTFKFYPHFSIIVQVHS